MLKLNLQLFATKKVEVRLKTVVTQLPSVLALKQRMEKLSQVDQLSTVNVVQKFTQDIT